jgi:hypothetical protein
VNAGRYTKGDAKVAAPSMARKNQNASGDLEILLFRRLKNVF